MFPQLYSKILTDLIKRRAEEAQNSILENADAVSNIATLVKHPDGVLVVPKEDLVIGNQDIIGVVFQGGGVKNKKGEIIITDGIGKV
jgi:hypothetical protein